ncbi:MAG: hypothetical protein J7J25_01300 [Candidatus Omnitrophica bacterium]|nr:hypothetical protein [Candidatus Omnitrophota bacterium]
MRRKSLTFMEIIVSAIILSTSIVALLSTFVSVKKIILRSSRRLVAANIARDVLDSLYPEVREDTWGKSVNGLSAGNNYSTSYSSTQIGESKYTAKYDVEEVNSAVSGADAYRKVKVTVSYSF